MKSLSALSDLVQTHDAWQWLFVAAAMALLGVRVVRAWLAGDAGLPAWRRLVEGAARRNGLAGWSAAGIEVGLWALGVAFVGFMWDVAWHADTGRDRELFTVPHMLILIGLGGIFAAGLVSAWIGRRQAGRLPFSSVPLSLVGFGALVGFPLDDYWHSVYGIDVTMWSPTHLLMIGGASLAPLALWLMSMEGGSRRPRAPLAAAVLIGLSTFQLEFDMGIPQWQLLFHPALIAAAAGIGLVAARAALGRGGALLTAGMFLVTRLALLVLIGSGLGYVLPRFPLYLGEALCVELVFLVLAGRAPLLQGAVSGALIGTAGLATEWGWTHIWYPHPWPANLLNDIWIAVVIAVAAGVVGVAVGRVIARQPAGVPAAAVVVALAAIGGLLAWHLPLRTAPAASATVSTHTVGSVWFATDRDGQVSLRRNVSVDVAVAPAAAAAHPDWLTIVAWQGGAPVQVIDLKETAPGRYRSASLVPVGGSWKTLVFLARGDVVAAVPVAMPPDPGYGLPGIDAPAQRTEAFVPASKWLMRETHGGVIWPALFATVAFALFVVGWAAALGWAYRGFSLRGDEHGAPGGLDETVVERRRDAARGGQVRHALE